MQFANHRILNNHFILSSQRAVFWEEEKTLILSDLHLGKTGHFRKHGIPVPQLVFKEDMQRLVSLLQLYKPSKLIVVGDLFHSTANKEYDFFLKWRNDFTALHIDLVMGNHDILKEYWYKDASISVIKDQLQVGDFIFIHDIANCIFPCNGYVFSGHVHPGITIKGGGKQLLRFPCFYFGEHTAILPAYGKFTGTYTLSPKKGKTIFAIVENNIVQIQ